MAEPLKRSSPVVRRTTGFHHHDRCGLIGHECPDLLARQSMPGVDMSRLVRDAYFENRLCQVNCDACTLHDGFLLRLFWLTIVMTLALRCRSSHQEESISSSAPSLEASPYRARASRRQT